MDNKWFNLQEQGAGEKRLQLSLFLYRVSGSVPIRIIAFFVAVSVFFSAKERRCAAQKFFTVLNEYTEKNYSVFFSSLKLFINYANSLVDRIISFSGKMKDDKFVFASLEERDRLFRIMSNGGGVFFITTHVGNIEILRSFLMSDKFLKPRNVNIFLQPDICKKFNKFLKKAAIKTNVEFFSVDDIDMNTSLALHEKLQNGEISFIAGDRISANNVNKTYEREFLNRKIELPIGALRFGLLMDVPIFFIVCAKSNGCYKIHLSEFTSGDLPKKEKLERLKRAYGNFLEKYTLAYPHQFYNFFDIFC